MGFRTKTETSKEECVAGNNDDAGCDMWNKASTVQFQSEPNVLYAVYVDGPRTAGGLFELDISCVDAPSVGPSVAPTHSLLPTRTSAASPENRPVDDVSLVPFSSVTLCF